tara:strand:+ start:656 stop:769 length:114 start_codon:yes stop_codon:yes gene_type:complete
MPEVIIMTILIKVAEAAVPVRLAKMQPVANREMEAQA